MTANHRPLEEGDIELIERVKATPCLYDTRNPDFRLVYKKEQQWQSVADGLIMTHWEARKRWTVLRDRYARELKQLLLHPDSMEYGKSEFFHRMDFLRNFVKKRCVRKKCYSSSSQHSEDMKNKLRQDLKLDINNAIPIKIFKVDQDSERDCLASQHSENVRKSFIIEDSQDSSTGRYSYIEQEANDEVAHEHDGDTNTLVEHCQGEQEYNDYVEDNSAAYEAVEEHETQSHYVPNHPISTIGGNSNKTIAAINFANIGDKLTQLPQLQQRPSICSLNTSNSNELHDSEEYFSKTIALYLKQLSRRHKIKAKVEMMQILEKYIELEETKDNYNNK